MQPSCRLSIQHSLLPHRLACASKTTTARMPVARAHARMSPKLLVIQFGRFAQHVLIEPILRVDNDAVLCALVVHSMFDCTARARGPSTFCPVPPERVCPKNATYFGQFSGQNIECSKVQCSMIHICWNAPCLRVDSRMQTSCRMQQLCRCHDSGQCQDSTCSLRVTCAVLSKWNTKTEHNRRVARCAKC